MTPQSADQLRGWSCGPRLCACMRACSATQPRLTLCDPRDCNPPGSSVHGTSQVRILEWVTFPPRGDLPDPKIQPASPTSPALQVNSLPLSHQGSPPCLWSPLLIKVEGWWFPRPTSNSSRKRMEASDPQILPSPFDAIDLCRKKKSSSLRQMQFRFYSSWTISYCFPVWYWSH